MPDECLERNVLVTYVNQENPKTTGDFIEWMPPGISQAESDKWMGEGIEHTMFRFVAEKGFGSD